MSIGIYNRYKCYNFYKLMMKLGAHQSISGGYSEALKRISNIGGNCLQIFSSSPRGWNFANPNDDEIKKFSILNSEFSISPIYFHATYLINLADDGRIGHMSKMSLINELNLAPKLGIKGSIIHLGSFKEKKQLPIENYLIDDRPQDNKYKVLINNIKEILDKTPKDSLFIIENAGNRKIGQTLEEISQIVKDVNNKRIRLCLDTCHLFSNGYKFDTNKELDFFLAKLVKLEINNLVELWHVNDSRDEFDSGHDRHDNIGQGKMNIDEFKTLLNHPQTKNFPFIIETPGFDGNGPDKKNLDILKSLVGI
ncbi:MAG: putative endonuclease 4 [Candidatus Roizmanbacteria bacterium GW2011_GWC2_34_23]|uniref:Putative endonuclease 4 n=2 Tax=Candidatus Roizmaniibacteriota TaxID=1752723 RepID=A0A0G0E713_9BACT|nr:MAG: putative endonuclease 4 [Candidatus Roizmanbacteria bacterium GW2011_GWC2_34_23]